MAETSTARLRRQGKISAERFFDASGNRRKKAIVPRPSDKERQYTGETFTLQSGPLAGCRLKVYRHWDGRPKRSSGGCWARLTELHPEDAHLAPHAALHTSRTLQGTPKNPKIATAEAPFAARMERGLRGLDDEEEEEEDDDEAAMTSCFRCGLQPGDVIEVPRSSISHTVHSRHFYHDHVDDEDPTTLREFSRGHFKEQLESGKAQWLCFFCNDLKTNGQAGQGDSCSHTNRERTQANEKAHGGKRKAAPESGRGSLASALIKSAATSAARAKAGRETKAKKIVKDESASEEEMSDDDDDDEDDDDDDDDDVRRSPLPLPLPPARPPAINLQTLSPQPPDLNPKPSAPSPSTSPHPPHRSAFKP